VVQKGNTGYVKQLKQQRSSKWP